MDLIKKNEFKNCTFFSPTKIIEVQICQNTLTVEQKKIQKKQEKLEKVFEKKCKTQKTQKHTQKKKKLKKNL